MYFNGNSHNLLIFNKTYCYKSAHKRESAGKIHTYTHCLKYAKYSNLFLCICFWVKKTFSIRKMRGMLTFCFCYKNYWNNSSLSYHSQKIIFWYYLYSIHRDYYTYSIIRKQNIMWQILCILFFILFCLAYMIM